MKAIAYARFSPRRNSETCPSIEKQLEQIHRFASSGQNTITIEAEFSDANKSGNDHERPGIWQAMAALKRGMALIVLMPDRLARDTLLAEMLHQEARQKGAKILYVQGADNADTPEAKLLRQIMQSIAEYQRELIAIRTKYGMLRNQAAGRRMSAKPPYGMMRDPLDDKRLVPDSSEQNTIAKIRRLREAGGSPTWIAHELDREGIPCRDSKKWHHSQIQKILEREKA